MSDEPDLENPLDDPEERRVLYATLDSFRQYRTAAHYNITYLRRQSFYSLPSNHVDILSGAPFSFPSTLRQIDDAIDSNADLSERIMSFGLQGFGIHAEDESWKGQATPADMDKARSTIRQFWRDWSAEGGPEREIYSAVVTAIAQHLPLDTSERYKCNILIPGAGLGRLVFELCRAGYVVEGNEISYHQLMASSYILNFTQCAGQHTLYPWALNFNNHRRRVDQMQAVAIPDIHPAAVLEAAQAQTRSKVHFSERMSMSAGDFCDVYSKPRNSNAYQSVVTCFFIDTAPNPIRYIETVSNCLERGGLWVNVGPLLWHFESTPINTNGVKDGNDSDKGHASPKGLGEPGSVQLTDEEVVALIAGYGFSILEQREVGECGYIQQPHSMLRNMYRPSFWVARKE
ncbi:N2227-domain-containing protein [Polychaeton citri CBS 116435]|uniref:carnosine N-methyltransferase n=1 Tax=Polychaeton citri CBS 116435 TaxID=1314669 RepID=A0A9P4Q0M1_9PEZI|nr:N2227-domain-containing protein [Polychaeton citri CBS 116435]